MVAANSDDRAADDAAFKSTAVLAVASALDQVAEREAIQAVEREADLWNGVEARASANDAHRMKLYAEIESRVRSAHPDYDTLSVKEKVLASLDAMGDGIDPPHLRPFTGRDEMLEAHEEALAHNKVFDDDAALDELEADAVAPDDDGDVARDDVDPAATTDTGNAERFAAMHRARARFVPQWNVWLVFDGRRWHVDHASVHVGALAKESVRAIYAEASRATDRHQRADLVKWARSSETKKARSAMVDLARSEKGMALEHTALDADPWLFNVANGTLDLRTGTLRPHRASDLLTKLSPVTYNPDATCPRFERFLSEIMAGDAERVEFLRRFFGYCLTGIVSEHVLCFWYGRTGGNGKSTLLALLLYILGDYAQKAAPDLLFKSEKTDRHPTEIASLFGARLVVCNETSNSRVWDESTVKDLAGGDRLTARRMRENFWSFDPTHKIVVAGNNKPPIRDAGDGGMQRRLRLVPFEVTFKAAPDKSLGAKLEAEAPGVLSYLVRACLDWQASGLTEPASITSATAEYFAEEDAVGRFIAECCELAPGATCSRETLRKANVAWAEESDEKPANPKALSKWLRDHNVTEAKVRDSKGSRRGWRGVRVKDDGHDRRGGQCTLS